jgi:hypothetical protein
MVVKPLIIKKWLIVFGSKSTIKIDYYKGVKK